MSLPAPLLPASVDLRGLDYMPLFGNHLFGSEFNAAASDGEWRAALTLWWAAWNQVPAGSLPDDDAALCRLADLGRDVKTWKKLRARAIHGFVKCSDGRLYHEFLCQQAEIAWDKRCKERDRKAAWRAQQDAKKAGQAPPKDVPATGTKTGTETGTGQVQDADVPADGKGRDGTGRDGIEIPSVAKATDGDAVSLAKIADPDEIILGYGVPLLTGAGATDRNARSFLGGLRKHHGDQAVIAKLRECMKAKPLQPLEWLAGALPPPAVDVVRITVAGPKGQDPALVKRDQDDKLAAPPPAEIREKIRELTRKSA